MPPCASPAPCRWARGLLAELRLAVHGLQKRAVHPAAGHRNWLPPWLPPLPGLQVRPKLAGATSSTLCAHCLCSTSWPRGLAALRLLFAAKPCLDVYSSALYSELQRELAKGWRVPATVFYDRPPDFFRPATLEVRGWLCVGWRLCLVVRLVLADDAHAVCGAPWAPRF